MHDYQPPGSRIPASVLRIIQEAGYDTENQDELAMGTSAYNTALLVWHAYQGSALHSSQMRIPFNPRLLPRVARMQEVRKDYDLLGSLMEQDDELKAIVYSGEKVSDFLTKANRREKLSNHEEEFQIQIEKLAERYFPISGEMHIFESLKEKLIQAAVRAKSEDELRALALGVYFSWAQFLSENKAQNPLVSMIFRRSVTRYLLPHRLCEEVVEKAGGESVFLEKAQSGSGKVKDEMDSILESLGGKEKTVLLDFVHDRTKELEKVISDGKFPVPLPFVTLLPFLLDCAKTMKGGKRPTPEIQRTMMDRAKAALLPEDNRVFEILLRKWLEQNPHENGPIKHSVRLVLAFAELNLMDAYFEPLLCLFLRHGSEMGLIEWEEGQIIKPWKMDAESGHVEFLQTYSQWLRSKGYPQLAERTQKLTARLFH